LNNFVPMFELNGEIFYKVFECGKIPSYMDPSKKYNENYIAEVAKNYDPVNVHEAPFWIGHPEYFTEPRSGGWIKRVLAVGKELYVTFSEVYPWMKELFNSGEFKKCSVEMGDLEINSEGQAIPYLWALGATNIPAVKGLPALSFPDADHKMSDNSRLKGKVCFSLMNFDYDNKTNKKFENKIKFNTEMENIKKLAQTLGITIPEDAKEADITSSIETKITEIKASEAKAIKDLQESNDNAAVKLVDNAVELGKITPAQKDEFLNFAKASYQACAKVLNTIPEKNLTGGDTIAKGRFQNANDLKNPALSNVTYEDVLRDPDKFIGVLKEDEILKLKEGSARFKDVPSLDK